jgi:hypothetical protein
MNSRESEFGRIYDEHLRHVYIKNHPRLESKRPRSELIHGKVKRLTFHVTVTDAKRLAASSRSASSRRPGRTHQASGRGRWRKLSALLAL